MFSYPCGNEIQASLGKEEIGREGNQIQNYVTGRGSRRERRQTGHIYS